jgi:hypothetical protein
MPVKTRREGVEALFSGMAGCSVGAASRSVSLAYMVATAKPNNRPRSLTSLCVLPRLSPKVISRSNQRRSRVT